MEVSSAFRVQSRVQSPRRGEGPSSLVRRWTFLLFHCGDDDGIILENPPADLLVRLDTRPTDSPRSLPIRKTSSGFIRKHPPSTPFVHTHLKKLTTTTFSPCVRVLAPCKQLAGKPNPKTFPFSSMTLHLKPPLEAPVSLVRGSAEGTEGKKDDDGGIDLEIAGEDMEEALQ